MISTSIIIPSHNAERYLGETVNSLLKQSLLPSEIIIIDDDSSDKSLPIARQLSSKFPEIISVYSKKFRSATKSRNFGAFVSTGEALMFLDADDVISPNTLEVLSDILLLQRADIAACPWLRLEMVDGDWVAKPASCALRRSNQDALSAWLTGWYYPPCAILWSREAYKKIGGWDEEATINQDGDIMMRALAQGIRLVESANGTAYYRRAPAGQQSLSGKGKTLEGLKGRIWVLDKLTRILDEHRIYALYQESLSAAYWVVAKDAKGVDGEIHREAKLKAKSSQYIFFKAFIFKAIKKLMSHSKKVSGTKPTPDKYTEKVDWISIPQVELGRVLREPSELEKYTPPSVSIVIPVYNRAHLLHRALDSVVEQTFKDIEILVIDDCSQDDPYSVIEKYNDPRIKYIRQKYNQGVAAARNRGLREAIGTFVAFLDDDDKWYPEKIVQQVALFSKSAPDVGLVYTGVETILDNDVMTVSKPLHRGYVYPDMLIRNALHGGSSAMIRRNVIASVGFFDETLPAIEDYDYWLRISRCYKFDFIEIPLVVYYDLRQDDEDHRRSLNFKANMQARQMFYIKHRKEMIKHRTAHLYLAQTANRYMSSKVADYKNARFVAIKAFLIFPGSARSFRVLVKSLIAPYINRGGY